jgi:nitrate reductase NapD
MQAIPARRLRRITDRFAPAAPSHDRMDISSVILWARPEKRARVRTGLAAMPGVQIHADCDDGRFVLTIEDTPGRSTADALLQLQDLDGVIHAAPVYSYCDDALAQEPHK